MSTPMSAAQLLNEDEMPFAQTLSMRAITSDDMPDLTAMYADSRAREMQFFPFTPEQSTHFLQMQFNAQHQHYQSHYPNASYELILLNNKKIGRLYVERGRHEILIIDILILSAYCQRGIGTVLLKNLINEANNSNARLTAHVELNNPARRLYRRLGFKEIEQHGPYLWIVKDPNTTNDDLPSRT